MSTMTNCKWKIFCSIGIMFVAPAMIWSNPAAPMIYYVLLVLLGTAAVVCMWSASPESLLILRVIVALCCSVAIGVMMLGTRLTVIQITPFILSIALIFPNSGWMRKRSEED